VPGYDLNDITADSFTQAQLKPNVKQPCFIARQFVDAELSGKPKDGNNIEIPQFVPPGWDPTSPNYWVNGNSLFADNTVGGAIYSSSNQIRVRLTVSVAGTLIGESVSFSSGHITYSNGKTDPELQPVGDCVVSLSSLKGTVNVIAYNDGSELSSAYSISVDCEDNMGKSQNENQDFGTFQLAPSQSAPVSIAIETPDNITLTSSTFKCSVSLTIPGTFGADRGVLSSLPIQCTLMETINKGEGGIVFGNDAGSGNSNSYDPSNPNGDKDDPCESLLIAPFCLVTGWFGDIGGFIEYVEIWVAIIITFVVILMLFCCVSYRIDDMVAKLDYEAGMRRAVVRREVQKVRKEKETIEALKEELDE